MIATRKEEIKATEFGIIEEAFATVEKFHELLSNGTMEKFSNLLRYYDGMRTDIRHQIELGNLNQEELLEWAEDLRYALIERRKIKNTIALLDELRKEKVVDKVEEALSNATKEKNYAARVIDVPVAKRKPPLFTYKAAFSEVCEEVGLEEEKPVTPPTPAVPKKKENVTSQKLHTLSFCFVTGKEEQNGSTRLLCNLQKKKAAPKFFDKNPERIYLMDKKNKKSLWTLSRKTNAKNLVYVLAEGAKAAFPEYVNVSILVTLK